MVGVNRLQTIMVALIAQEEHPHEISQDGHRNTCPQQEGSPNLLLGTNEWGRHHGALKLRMPLQASSMPTGPEREMMFPPS